MPSALTMRPAVSAARRRISRYSEPASTLSSSGSEATTNSTRSGMARGECDTAAAAPGEHLTKAVRAVVKHNPTLAGVIDIVDFAAERNGEPDINPAKLRGVGLPVEDSQMLTPSSVTAGVLWDTVGHAAPFAVGAVLGSCSQGAPSRRLCRFPGSPQSPGHCVAS